MNHLTIIKASVCCLLLWNFSGCNNGPEFHTFTGSVTYQGKPVAEGEIIFADVNGLQATAHGTIKNGKYTLETLEGEKKVRITARQKTGEMITGAMGAEYPEEIDLIPAQYNSATTLSVKVDPSGELSKDFDLKEPESKE